MTTMEVLSWVGWALLGWTALSIACVMPVALWFRSKALENEQGWQGEEAECPPAATQTRLA